MENHNRSTNIPEESILPEEQLLFRLRNLYRRYGYRMYRMSKFEKYEFYAGNKDFLASDRIITFHDTDGELLALKPDVTLSIVKSAQFRPLQVERLFYQENVYRPFGSAGHFREMLQCGLECIGDLDYYGMFEVLFLAEQSLRAVSEDSVLSFSHLGLLKGLFRKLGVGEAVQMQLLSLIAARNLHELTALFAARGWENSLLQDLQALLGLSCTLAQLPQALQALSLSWAEEDVLEELRLLALLSRHTEDRALFDFSVINDLHYYNGLAFQGFIRGISEKILSGGRYDSLLRRMDKKGSAAGFAVYLGLLEQQRKPQTEPEPVHLLYDGNSDLEAVWERADGLRNQGKLICVERNVSDDSEPAEDLRKEVRHA